MLDLAVVALAALVCATLLLLAWTLGVTGVGRVREARRGMLEARLQVAIVERRIWTDASFLHGAAARTAPARTAPAPTEGDE